MFSMQSVSQNILTATFQLSSATSLNLVSLKMVYSRHSLSQILRDMEKKLKTAGVRIKKSAIETGSYYRKSGYG